MAVVGVHVQVDVDQRALLQPARELRVVAAVVAAGDEAAVQVLELVGGLRSRSRGCAAVAQALAQGGLGDQAAELGGEGLAVVGLEEQAAAPSASASS